MNKVKIIVSGAAGKMGTRIIALAQNDKNTEVVGEIEAGGSYTLIENGQRKAVDGMELAACGDVLVDFSTPQASLEHLALAVAAGKAIVLGTTGFSEAETEKIKAAAGKIPVVFSPNMSVGVNLLFKLAAQVAKVLADYDIEILELHHNQKKDAPSGTAVKLAQVIASSLGRNIEDVGVYGRHGVIGPRKKEEIGVLAVRAGDIVGEHTVFFAGPGERIELTHRAHSRDTLASGALVAAKWLARQKSGLYDMQDVLGLKDK
jgi:4-hydroxy-tetrahydrodipicolinate reductase